MLFKSKDESISKIHPKTKELSIVDIRNKKQRLVIDAETVASLRMVTPGAEFRDVTLHYV